MCRWSETISFVSLLIYMLYKPMIKLMPRVREKEKEKDLINIFSLSNTLWSIQNTNKNDQD